MYTNVQTCYNYIYIYIHVLSDSRKKETKWTHFIMYSTKIILFCVQATAHGFITIFTFFSFIILVDFPLLSFPLNTEYGGKGVETEENVPCAVA